MIACNGWTFVITATLWAGIPCLVVAWMFWHVTKDERRSTELLSQIDHLAGPTYPSADGLGVIGSPDLQSDDTASERRRRERRRAERRAAEQRRAS